MTHRSTRREAMWRLAAAAGTGLWLGCSRDPPAIPLPAPLPPGTGMPPPGPAAPRHSYGPGPQQFGELSLPKGDGPFPVAVFVHGGFWSAGYDLVHVRSTCAALADAGWAVWNVEYRAVGHEGGGWPGTLLDVAAAADHLRTLAVAQRLDLKQVVSIGHSAGGHLALWLAARRRLPAGHVLHRPDPLPLLGAVALAGVCDLRHGQELGLGAGAVGRLLGGEPAAVPDRYAAASPAELLPLGTPQVLIHGAIDFVVPIGISRAYQKAATAKGDDVQLVDIPEGDHFGVINPRSAVWPSVKEALAKFVWWDPLESTCRHASLSIL